MEGVQVSTARIKVRMETPCVPNFIRSDGGVFDVAQFDDVILRDIGREWTKKLIANAEKRRRSQRGSDVQ